MECDVNVGDQCLRFLSPFFSLILMAPPDKRRPPYIDIKHLFLKCTSKKGREREYNIYYTTTTCPYK